MTGAAVAAWKIDALHAARHNATCSGCVWFSKDNEHEGICHESPPIESDIWVTAERPSCSRFIEQDPRKIRR